MDTVIAAFGWQSDQLIGNLSVHQMLTDKIDIRSKKLSNLKSLLESAENLQQVQQTIDTVLQSAKRFTLLELAEALDGTQVKLPVYLLEDQMPLLQKRFYSVTNDPTAEGCYQVRLLFSRHSFSIDGA